MITPLDIQEKEFSRVVRGYREEEVDDFLDMVIIQMETLIRENNALQQQLQELNEELEQFKNMEMSVTDTLEAAKSLVQEISSSAEKHAKITLKNAELDARRIKKEAQDEAEQLQDDNAALRRNFSSFKSKYRNLLESELQKFDTLTNELFPDFTISDLEDLEKESGAKEKTIEPGVKLRKKSDSRETVVFKQDL